MKCSIVIPVFNGSLSLFELTERIIKTFKPLSYSLELIFVDDFSIDNSWEVLNEIKKKYEKQEIKLIRLAKNFGQHNATICGFNYCTGDFVVTMDDDLQHPPEELPKMIDTFLEKKLDVLYGSSSKGHPFWRKLLSKTVKKLLKYVENTTEFGSSFRIINSVIVAKLKTQKTHFIFIDQIIQWYTNNSLIIKVKYETRKYNKSNYSVKKIISLWKGLYVFYTTILLRLMIMIGGIGAIILFVLGICLIVEIFIYNTETLSYNPLIITILFALSIVLLSLGIVGQYIAQMFLSLNSKPVYHIKEDSL